MTYHLFPSRAWRRARRRASVRGWHTQNQEKKEAQEAKGTQSAQAQQASEEGGKEKDA